jgi:lysophospholipase L1-like esterase
VVEVNDTDRDGYFDPGDNCPTTANPAQADADADGIGDACEEPQAPIPPASTPTRDVPLVIALGDSIASGEGVPPYDKYPAGSRRNHHCHRSKEAYAREFAFLQARRGDRVKVRLFACAGAKIDQITRRSQGKKAGDPVERPQIKRIAPETDLVTLTVGANDVGWGRVLASCVTGLRPCHWSQSSFRERILGLKRRLVETYSQLQERTDGRVVIVGYPHYVPPAYRLSNWQMERRCSSFSRKELKWLRQRTIDAENMMRAAIRTVNEKYFAQQPLKYVSTLHAFKSHELCMKDKWIHGVRWKNIEESGHPNRAGQAALARLLHKSVPRLD